MPNFPLRRLRAFLFATCSLILAQCLSPTTSSRAMAAEESEPTRRPNILFAIADDWSYGHASVYGCPWVKTPSFDRIAKEGLLFTNAYTPNAKCAPSRAIILTGRYSWQLEEAGNHMCDFPPKFGSFVERLAADGYAAGFTGKGWGPGIANDVDGNPREITGKRFSSKKAKPPAKMISSIDYAANFQEFLAASSDDKPWVFWFGTTEPHRAYEYGIGVRSGMKTSDVDHVPAYWPDNETTRNDMLDYGFEVQHYDDHLGRILKTLEQAGELENTLIVATSDHGMPFPRAKGQAYDESNHIPLAIRWPAGINQPGRSVDEFVDFAGLAPTFLKVAGVTEAGPIMQPTTGTDWVDIFAAEKSGVARDHVLVGKERHDIGRPNQGGYPIRGIRKGNLLYLKNFATDRWPAGNPETGYLNCDGGATKTEILNMRRTGTATTFWNQCFGKRPQEELYDVTADPDCVNNLAADPSRSQDVSKLRQQMERELKSQGDPRMFGNGDVFDRYEYTSQSSVDFYERYTAGEKIKAGWVNPSDFEKEPIE